MTVRNVQILNSAVTTSKVAADTIIPADVDETAAYNFSSTSNTIVAALGNFSSTNSSIGGVGGANLPDVTASETVSGAWDFSSNNSTIGGVTASNLVDKSTTETVSGAWNMTSTSNTIVAALGNFSSTNSSIGGVGGANILDKTAAETVSGAWDFSGTSNTFTGSAVEITTFVTNGTNTGFCAGNATYPTATSSTVFLNAICTTVSKVFVSPRTSILSSAGTVLVPFISTSTGSFTVGVALATSSAFDFNYLVVN